MSEPGRLLLWEVRVCGPAWVACNWRTAAWLLVSCGVREVRLRDMETKERDSYDYRNSPPG